MPVSTTGKVVKKIIATQFWAVKPKSDDPKTSRRALRILVDQVSTAPHMELFEAVESGVPTYTVNLIAAATGESATSMKALFGVPESTYRRKDDASEPLPEAAGHRVMGFLRVLATLRRLLKESGDPKVLESFDIETWLRGWMREPLLELKGKSPAEALRNPEGVRAVEQVLERMRGGLPA